MSAPSSIRVKLSSEAAGAISLTPVVVREMPFAELVDFIVPFTGKDLVRLTGALQVGSFVSGATRLRWEPFGVTEEALRSALATYPDPDPSRQFDPSRCARVILTGASCRIELSREPCARKRFLKRRSFWDALMHAASSVPPAYLDYSYRDRADLYRAELDVTSSAAIRQAASLLTYSSLIQQIQRAPFHAAEFAVSR